jgi:thiol-disulfide isomerase/thioredoxin
MISSSPFLRISAVPVPQFETELRLTQAFTHAALVPALVRVRHYNGVGMPVIDRSSYCCPVFLSSCCVMTSSPPEPRPLIAETAAKPLAQQFRNLSIVLVAVGLSLLLGFGLQQQSASPSLTALAKSAISYETALVNGKPSLVEFYANWCTSCQAMTRDMAALKSEYGDRINFVMLNVDNSKWLPEVMRYRVEGIPHFVFLDRKGSAIAGTIGEQPRTILSHNLDALIAEAPLPVQSITGQTSAFEPEVKASSGDPRNHGGLPAGA